MDAAQTPELPRARIRIVGTSHIAKRSAEEIKHAFKEFAPDIVAVELDRRRLEALKEDAAGKKERRLPLSMVKQIGATGYLFALVGRAVQKRMGNVMNVNPGIDMLTAVRLAEAEGKELRLVDQDILITMRHLSDRFTFRERLRIAGDILGAPFSRRKYKIPLDKVPDDKMLEELMGLLKERYPSLHHVLIVERNIVMARNLDAIVRRNPGKRILLVIGAGHGDDLRARLKPLERLATIE